MPQSVLIIGEDPTLIDFSAPGVPPDMDADKVMRGLNDSQNRLEHAGHDARILLTKDAQTVEAQVSEALRDHHYDVIVIGAGLRTLPPMARQFERLMNVLHEQAPQAKLAFNSRPDDSDKAALRWLSTA
jgi:trans-aconitate methyltransferase